MIKEANKQEKQNRAHNNYTAWSSLSAITRGTQKNLPSLERWCHLNSCIVRIIDYGVEDDAFLKGVRKDLWC